MIRMLAEKQKAIEKATKAKNTIALGTCSPAKLNSHNPFYALCGLIYMPSNCTYKVGHTKIQEILEFPELTVYLQ